jgi:hypothetical protein
MTADLTVNETLLERAFHAGGLESQGETVNAALEEFIEKRAREDVLLLFNTVEYDENYDYKKLRGKR